ncbi:ankyrin repeat domain-containing protein [Streptomyces sp. L2]|uniref:ankyrin repeat domain-containing protein n=1 Tax=Streptomyces sp. L2 TaxID=2162665 RepID=UPI00101351E1|nr:ankyrin repeat domain-containing protein [Streptomyces sp. L2]
MDDERTAEWDGITLRSTLLPEGVALRDRLADAARDGRWHTVFEILDEAPSLANSTRLGGSSGYTPLHQAAWYGTSPETTRRLLAYSAFRTLRTREGARAVDIAAERGHDHLTGLLRPEIRHPLPPEVRAALRRNLHRLIHHRTGDGNRPDLATREELRLPDAEILTELARPVCWFPVPGMYGGFRIELTGGELTVDSWVRVVEGSERTDRVTACGVHLQEGGLL